MTNNLRKAKKDLCSFAKKCKDFKYTDSALITFLITGAVITYFLQKQAKALKIRNKLFPHQ